MLFGTLVLDGRQLFRQCDLFNQDTFLDYLKQIKRKLGKAILSIERASQHRSRKVQEYLEENKDSLRINYLPNGSPQFNVVEECWRQRKYDLGIKTLFSIYRFKIHHIPILQDKKV